jgi:proteasome accessory factor C
MSPAAGISARLPRLLSLVPYLLAHPGVRVAEMAEDFGVPEKQLWRDLELLWMCGLPGYGPGDLVDLSFTEDTVTVTEDAGMRRPLRLSPQEATSLLVALRALTEVPGMVDTDVVQRAVAKIESAVGGPAGGAAAGVAVGLTAREEATTSSVRAALDRRRALWMRYYTASRDVVSERTVDPMRLLLVEGHSYLEAWCRSAEGVRLFRLDRMEEVRELDEPARPPVAARPTDLSAGLFHPDPEQGEAWLHLDPDARWVAEYYPVDEVVEHDDGHAEVRLRFSDDAWLVRLVLGLGGRARVLRPEHLRGQVAARAAEALRSA